MVPGREASLRGVWVLSDTAVAVAAVYASAWLRYDLNPSLVFTTDVTWFAGLYGVVFLCVALVAGYVSRTHPRGTFEETAQVARRWFLASAVVGPTVFIAPWFHVPRSLPFVAPVLAIVGMYALRFIVRSYRWGRTAVGEADRPTIIYGAGEGGQQLLRALTRDRAKGRLVPVAIIDDDPRKKRWKIEGVRVRGGAEQLPEIVENTGASTLAVAIPSIEQEGLQRIRALARQCELELLVLPSTAHLLGAPRGADLRRLNLEDLLGRRQVTLNATEISGAITGKRVLVTGAGGSIGSELARQISRFGPAKLILLDRDESALHATQLSLTGRALLDDGTLALCDIRDPDALHELFERERPEVVFHTAALKHLTLLEQFPLEAWKTNIVGTLNVLEAAYAVGVQTFVNISTDKAANPTCVLGYSKRVAERLTAEFAHRDDSTYVSVRFGNVLGSRGSVLTAFTAQIERGGPVTVTHPDVERYFMLIPEACQLVLQAAAIGQDGEVMVLDMGEPVKIVEVARTLIDLSGKDDIRIDFTGLRPGEKLSEELFTAGAAIKQSAHPLVRHVAVPALTGSIVSELEFATSEDSRAWMQRESFPTPPVEAEETAFLASTDLDGSPESSVRLAESR